MGRRTQATVAGSGADSCNQQDMAAAVHAAEEAAERKCSLELAALQAEADGQHAAAETRIAELQAEAEAQIAALRRELSCAKQQTRAQEQQGTVESAWQQKLIDKVLTQACTKIQSRFRGHRARMSYKEQLELKHASAKQERIEGEKVLYRHHMEEFEAKGDGDSGNMSPTQGGRLPLIISPQCEDVKEVKVKRIPTGRVLAKLKFIQSRYYHSYEEHILGGDDAPPGTTTTTTTAANRG